MKRLDAAQRARVHAAVDALLDVLSELADDAPAATPDAPAPLVDKREIARALSVSPATIDRLDREGQPHVRIGDAKRYDVAAVLAWHRARPAPDAPASSPRPLLPPASAPGEIKILTRRGRAGQ